MMVESTVPMSESSDESDSAPSPGDLDRLLGEIAAMSQQPVEPAVFHAALLDRLLSIVAALGGAVWTRRNDGSLQTDVERLPSQNSDAADSSQSSRRRLVEQLMDSGKSAVFPPAGREAPLDSDANTTGWLLIACPVMTVEGAAVAAVEIFQRPDCPLPVRDGSRQILEDVCEIAGDFYRRREVTALRERAALWGRFEQFTHAIHSVLELKPTTYAIVNEARTLIGCERVSLLDYRYQRIRLLAVSGVDEANRRSNVVRSLEQLCESVLRADEPLWMTDQPPDLAPQIEQPLQAYLESSPARMLAVVPLKESTVDVQPAGSRNQLNETPANIGVLVAESFDQPADAEMTSRIGAVCGQAAIALQNAQKYDDRGGFFGPLRQRWRASRLGAKLGFAVAGFAIVLAALMLIPADFDVPTRGELLPQNRRDVYAPADGIVHLADRENPSVREKEILAVLKNLPLERQVDQVVGELRIVDEQLKAIRNARGDRGRDKDDPPDTRTPLTAREQELEQQRTGLLRQLEILKAQRTALTVRSPLTGQILTYDVVRRMDTRPVVRGDTLMSIARIDGPWELELRLTQRQAGYVLDAQKRSKKPLTLQFTLLDSPGETHAATVTRVSQAVQDDGTDQPFVIVTATVSNPKSLPLRSGATVTARIHCGRRSIGYVWFHDLIDTARNWWAL